MEQERKFYDAYVMDLLKSLHDANVEDCRELGSAISWIADSFKDAYGEPTNAGLLASQLNEVIFAHGMMKRQASFFQNVPQKHGGA